MTSLTPLLETHTGDKFFTKDELSELSVGIGVFFRLKTKPSEDADTA